MTAHPYAVTPTKINELQRGMDREIAADHKTEWSILAGARIRKAMEQEKVSALAIAERTGVNRKTIGRLLTGENSDLNLAVKCWVSLGGNPRDLLDPNPNSETVSTGYKPIDEMLRSAYNDWSFDGLSGAANWVSSNYMCCSRNYRFWNPPQTEHQRIMNKNLKPVDTGILGDNMLGIDFETERKLNTEHSTKYKLQHRISLDGVDVISPTAIIVDITNIEVSEADNVAFSTRKIIERLEFTRPIPQIVEGYKCRIKRKIWRQLRFNRALMIS